MKKTNITRLRLSQKRSKRQPPEIGEPWFPYPNLRMDELHWFDGPVPPTLSARGIENDDPGNPGPETSIIAFPKRYSTARLGSTNSDFVRQYCASVARHMNGRSSTNKETLISVDFKERKRVNPR